jgi:hypothetical protein
MSTGWNSRYDLARLNWQLVCLRIVARFDDECGAVRMENGKAFTAARKRKKNFYYLVIRLASGLLGELQAHNIMIILFLVFSNSSIFEWSGWVKRYEEEAQSG